MRNPQTILITGASNGIGAALAEAYADRGVRLVLGARNAARLAAVAERCRAAGAEVAEQVIDVTDRDAVARWIAGADAERPLELVVANAGIAIGTRGADDIDRVARDTFATNVDGVFNTVHPALELMAARGRGQLALVSSLAGFRGLASSPAYCASKAAVRSYGESLRGFAGRYGVQVSVICPGFVRSGMTATNRFPMPFLMDADKAAALIRARLARAPAMSDNQAPTPATVRRTPRFCPATLRYRPKPISVVNNPILKIFAPITTNPPS